MAKSATARKRDADWSLPAHQARSRETRDRLLAAAERVFDRKGYEGTRIADIAGEAGCSVGAVYMRFKDKDALFRGIVAQFGSEVASRVSVTPGGSDPASAVAILVRGTARQFETHRGLFRAILERGLGDAEAFAPMVEIRERVEAMLEGALRPTWSRKTRDLGLAVRVTTQMVFGFLLNAIANPYAPTRGEGPRAVVELETAVLRYLDIEPRGAK